MTSEQQTTAYYDAEAAVYDDNRYGGRRGHRVDEFHRTILSEYLLRGLTPGSSVLEMGCGTGRLTRFAAGMPLRITGIDISMGMLAIAQSRFGKQATNEVTLTSGSLTALPFATGSFDAAYAILVLNLLSDLPQALAEARRVLKPGGLLLFNLPNLGSLYGLGGLYVNLRGKTVTRNTSGYRHSHWYSCAQVERMLSDAGFELQGLAGQPPWVRHRDAAAPLGNSRVGRMCSKSLYYKARLKAT